jgi:hypothetical protein
MNLYQVLYDGQHYYVEAESFTAAIGLWKIHVSMLWGEDYDGSEQPESVALIHDDPVIRSVNSAAAKFYESCDMLALIIAGVLRWEWSDAGRGELCYDGIRHFTGVDELGCPVIPTVELAARFHRDDRRGAKHHG